MPIDTNDNARQDDTLAGVSFPDPFRWLEGQTPEVKAWQIAQAELADAHVQRWPHYEALLGLVDSLQLSSFSMNHQLADGRWFRTATPAGGSNHCVMVSDSLAVEGQVLFDPASQNPAAPPYISWMRPAPNGRLVAIGLCTDGSENNRIALVDAATGALLPGAPDRLLMDNWVGGVQWLPDSSGFYFTALKSDSMDFSLEVCVHALDGRAAPPLPPQFTLGRDYSAVRISRCGRWAVLLTGMASGAPKAILDLSKPGAAWRPFVTDFGNLLAGDMEGDRYIAVTDAGAPRGRVVAIAHDSSTPNDPATWVTLVPESEAVIRSARVVGNHLYVHEFIDTYSRIRICDLDGAHVGKIQLPGRGAVVDLPITLMNQFPGSTGDTFLFGFSSFTQSAGLYAHRPGSAELEIITPPAVRLEGVTVEDRWVGSVGGVRVPYHVVRLAHTERTGPRPTLIHAYGAYNAPLKPQYMSAMAAFVLSGGTYVHAHIRGGGDLGRGWWDDGRHKNKQHGYDDLYAVAEDLIERSDASPSTLAVMGGSNGGLMAAVAATQRPDLWRVAVPRVPMTDLIGACRETYGRYIVEMEYADIGDPDEVRRLASFSPYQLARDGTRYPAIYIDAGDTDPRCPAWHSRKFGARMQAAQGSDEPILVRIWENVGHGWATPRSTMVRQDAQWLAFVMERTGLTPERPA